jgi:glycosyltransferase involved in cell wall biosynthesis
MIKTILISNNSLPYSKVGSWTSMYDYYLQQNHAIDYLSCPKPYKTYKNLEYKFTDKNISQKIKIKYFKYHKFNFILNKIEEIIEPNTNYIIQFIDNFGIVDYFAENLKKKYSKNKFYFQFFYHGYPPFYGNSQSKFFYESIDEMVLLTHLSYKEHIKYYTVLPCKFSVLHNGINNEIFNKKTLKEKTELRLCEGFSSEKKIFLWLSQDRPKKGLDFILNVWKKINNSTKENSELWIIGSNRKFDISGVKNLGRIPNIELPKYYQMADVYLFPTLCQEGFGLSLIEALHCGCYPIASKLGGVPEVLQNGKFGKLIENPHFEKEWKDEIEEIMLSKKEITNTFNDKLYTLKNWSTQMNNLIEEAKITLS